MNGTQTHLDFIPERTTDFIFAVYSEEFGLFGNVVLLLLFLLVIARGLVITANAPTLFARLLAGAITLTFFTYAFVNMGMVSGILPVVGVPLPLISYGGTSLVSICLGYGHPDEHPHAQEAGADVKSECEGERRNATSWLIAAARFAARRRFASARLAPSAAAPALPPLRRRRRTRRRRRPSTHATGRLLPRRRPGRESAGRSRQRSPMPCRRCEPLHPANARPYVVMGRELHAADRARAVQGARHRHAGTGGATTASRPLRASPTTCTR